MNADPETVIEQIDASMRVLDDMDRFLAEQALPGPGGPDPDRVKRVVAAQILENTYTAIETALLRISQGFDNCLDASRWHSDLLSKMTLEKNGIRPRVLSDETFRLLTELMRFRHFKRYYLELDYDWEKLQYLLSVRRRCLPRLREELAAFQSLVLRGSAR
jgi:hypothetical protein